MQIWICIRRHHGTPWSVTRSMVHFLPVGLSCTLYCTHTYKVPPSASLQKKPGFLSHPTTKSVTNLHFSWFMWITQFYRGIYIIDIPSTRSTSLYRSVARLHLQILNRNRERFARFAMKLELRRTHSKRFIADGRSSVFHIPLFIDMN